MVDIQQQEIAFALNAYTDSSYKRRNRFACIMSFLPRLRRLNSLCTQAFSQVQVNRVACGLVLNSSSCALRLIINCHIVVLHVEETIILFFSHLCFFFIAFPVLITSQFHLCFFHFSKNLWSNLIVVLIQIGTAMLVKTYSCN